MMLQARKLSFAYGSMPVLNEVDITIGPGITAILGPNATGKSTLLKCLCGILKPRGAVALDERELRSFTSEEVARRVSYLPQGFTPRAVLTVFETVLLGRLHQLAWCVKPDDTRRVERLLDEMGLSPIAGRYINELSGGQAQMVAIAQALVREPDVLLMDEPTSNLDLRHQFEVCTLLRDVTAARGISTAIALHDLNLAARFADSVYVLQAGRVRCAGTPAAVLTADLIAEVYGVETQVLPDDEGRPIITVLGPTLTKRESTA